MPIIVYLRWTKRSTEVNIQKTNQLIFNWMKLRKTDTPHKINVIANERNKEVNS